MNTDKIRKVLIRPKTLLILLKYRGRIRDA